MSVENHLSRCSTSWIAISHDLRLARSLVMYSSIVKIVAAWVLRATDSISNEEADPVWSLETLDMVGVSCRDNIVNLPVHRMTGGLASLLNAIRLHNHSTAS